MRRRERLQRRRPPGIPGTASAHRAARGRACAGRGRIRALAANPRCSGDSECHSLALGARACGGPESYLAWSSARTSPAEIAALAERYTAQRQAANKASGRVSTCVYLMDPGAVCRAGTCQPGAAPDTPLAR